ncbi:FecR family protein [Parapedobacter sp.]
MLHAIGCAKNQEKKPRAHRPFERFIGIISKSKAQLPDKAMRELFSKMLQGACTKAEIEQIITYLQSEGVDGDIPGIEEVRALLGAGERMDTQSASRIFQAIMDGKQTEAHSSKPIRFIRKPSFLVAASMAMVLTIAGALYLHQPKATARTAYGQIDSLRLADGTLVVLNANTEVHWPKDFMGGAKREIWIDGEAFFSVAHVAEKPFIVHTSGGMDVTVLGTAFNLNARGAEARVVLSKGRIKATYKDDEQFLLPGEMLSLAGGDQRLQKGTTDTLYHASWRHHLLAFKNEPLAQVAKTIHDRYGLQVQFEDPALRSLRFTGSVPANDLPLALRMIAMAFQLDIQQGSNTILIQTNEQQ